eukprot:sb/3466590/
MPFSLLKSVIPNDQFNVYYIVIVKPDSILFIVEPVNPASPKKKTLKSGCFVIAEKRLFRVRAKIGMSKQNVTKLNATKPTNSSSGGLWGALDTGPPIDNTFANISPADIHLTKTQTIPNTSRMVSDTIAIPRGDQNTVHQSIGLIRHNRDLAAQKRLLQRKIQRGDMSTITPPSPSLTLPMTAPPNPTPNVQLVEIPEISPETAALLLRKTAATCLCYTGFVTASSDALSLLSTTLRDYLIRFSETLRCELDKNPTDSAAFERVLHDMGVSGGFPEVMAFSRNLTVDYPTKLNDRRRVLETEISLARKVVSDGKFEMEEFSPTSSIYRAEEAF